MILSRIFMLASALAAVPSAAARSRSFNFDETAAGISDRDNAPVDKSFTSRPPPTHISSGVSCSSEAWSGSLYEYQGSYAEAVAHVVAYACSGEFDGNPEPLVREMEAWAGAYARAAARAQAQCFSSNSGFGETQGCAYSDAFAYAVAYAYATVHAEASAEAFAEHCAAKCTAASSWSFADADLELFLITDAYAEVAATVCASGQQSSSATAYVDCYGKIIAKTYAQAAAYAAAGAGCYSDQADADAATAVLAKFDSEITKWVACEVESTEDGLAESHTDLDASAYFADFTRR